MYSLALVLVIAVSAMALPQKPGIIPVLSRVETRDSVGQFALQYHSGDGTVFTEQGALKRNHDGTDNVLVKQGSYRYTSPEGIPIEVSYTADENGFHPQSAAIPVQQQPIQAVFV